MDTRPAARSPRTHALVDLPSALASLHPDPRLNCFAISPHGETSGESHVIPKGALIFGPHELASIRRFKIRPKRIRSAQNHLKPARRLRGQPYLSAYKLDYNLFGIPHSPCKLTPAHAAVAHCQPNTRWRDPHFERFSLPRGPSKTLICPSRENEAAAATEKTTRTSTPSAPRARSHLLQHQKQVRPAL